MNSAVGPVVRRLRATTSLALGLVMLVFAVNGALAQTESNGERENSIADQAAHKEHAPLIGGGAWTCSMHPQVHKAAAGKCPLCGMDLIHRDHVHAHDAAGIGRLDKMIEAALRGSPEVRAAEARLHMAEAELDQARLQAVERIVDYRRQWREQRAELEAAEIELQQAKQAANAASDDAQRERLQALAARAALRVQALQEPLAETEAAMTFLLTTRREHESTGGGQARKLIEEELLPKAEQILKASGEAYRQGEVDFETLLKWSERAADLKLQLARTTEERITALEEHRQLLEQIRDVAQALYKAGESPVTDVLAVEYRLDELKLKLLQLRQK